MIWLLFYMYSILFLLFISLCLCIRDLLVSYSLMYSVKDDLTRQFRRKATGRNDWRRIPMVCSDRQINDRWVPWKREADDDALKASGHYRDGEPYRLWWVSTPTGLLTCLPTRSFLSDIPAATAVVSADAYFPLLVLVTTVDSILLPIRCLFCLLPDCQCSVGDSDGYDMMAAPVLMMFLRVPGVTMLTILWCLMPLFDILTPS